MVTKATRIVTSKVTGVKTVTNKGATSTGIRTVTSKGATSTGIRTVTSKGATSTGIKTVISREVTKDTGVSVQSGPRCVHVDMPLDCSIPVNLRLRFCAIFFTQSCVFRKSY